jgi:hypothetical protein
VKTRNLVGSLALISLVAACSGGGAGGKTDSPLATSGDGTDTTAPTGDGPTLYGDVMSFPDLAPLAGVDVCRSDTMPSVCVKTNSDGAFRLPVPANGELAVIVMGDGYVPTVVGVATDAEIVDPIPTVLMTRTADSSRFEAALGVVADPAKGSVVAETAPGAQLAITAGSGAGPFTASFMGMGISMVGTLVNVPETLFANVDEGDVEVTATSTLGACTFPEHLWKGSTPGSVRLPVIAGFQTSLAYATCPTSAAR